jgi:hypothetical protein
MMFLLIEKLNFVPDVLLVWKKFLFGRFYNGTGCIPPAAQSYPVLYDLPVPSSNSDISSYLLSLPQNRLLKIGINSSNSPNSSVARN